MSWKRDAPIGSKVSMARRAPSGARRLKVAVVAPGGGAAPLDSSARMQSGRRARITTPLGTLEARPGQSRPRVEDVLLSRSMRTLALLFVGALALAGCGQRPCDGGLDAKRGPTARLDVSLATCNHRPVAELPATIRGVKRAAVTLDGSLSSDADGDDLSFEWRVVPPDPGVRIEGTGEKAQLFAEQQGQYELQLVVSDGALDSAAVAATVEIRNSVPVADAGADFTIPLGSMAQLDGSGSADLDGDPITYRWTLEARPPGSVATLDDATSAYPRFTPDVYGVYLLTLEVHDGFDASPVDSMKVGGGITGGPPVADAGPDVMGRLGQLTPVDGRGSADPDGDPITFAWRFTALPTQSAPAFVGTATTQASFRPDQLGRYEVELVVSDGFYDSDPDVAAVDVVPGSGVAGTPCDVGGCVEGALCFEGVCVGGGRLRFSLSWTVISDFDLHVLTPEGIEIYFANRSDGGGELDVDDCALDGCLPGTHVENVVFTDAPPLGLYRVWVENFTGSQAGDFRIEVYGAVRQVFTGSLPQISGASSPLYELRVR